MNELAGDRLARDLRDVAAHVARRFGVRVAECRFHPMHVVLRPVRKLGVRDGEEFQCAREADVGDARAVAADEAAVRAEELAVGLEDARDRVFRRLAGAFLVVVRVRFIST